MKPIITGSFIAAMLAFAVNAWARPTLIINKTNFCENAPGWRILVHGAAPNSTVTLKEWHQWTLGEAMTQSWDAPVGTTDANGDFFYEAVAPNFLSYFVAQVVIAGEVSNPVVYFTNVCE